MKAWLKLSCAVFALILYSCLGGVDPDSVITYNKSKNSIFSVISNSDDMSGSNYYNEFRDGQKTEKNTAFIFEEIKPNAKYMNHDRPRFWKPFFESSKDKKLRLFIIEKDSVDKYGWRQIFKKQIYNKKFSLSREDLETLNWQVTYE